MHGMNLAAALYEARKKERYRRPTVALRGQKLSRTGSGKQEAIQKRPTGSNPHGRGRSVPGSSLKGEVKKKHNCNGWIFSCFAAHLFEQDLF
jgi:hypothetical protein